MDYIRNSLIKDAFQIDFVAMNSTEVSWTHYKRHKVSRSKIELDSFNRKFITIKGKKFYMRELEAPKSTSKLGKLIIFYMLNEDVLVPVVKYTGEDFKSVPYNLSKALLLKQYNVYFL